MDTTSTTLIITVIVVLLLVGGIGSMVMSRRQRTKRLEERFGPEYDRAISEIGDQNQAEKALEERIAHVKALNIRPLSAQEVNDYSHDWQETQRLFVDEPLKALQKADRLIREVMKARGYPVEDFEQRVADISVNYPELVKDYRGLHHIAIKDTKEKVGTEEMRQAMVHGRALFEDLMKQESKDEQKIDQKEKI